MNRTYGINTISDDVYENIKNDILVLNIKPGTPITEQFICEKYEISRTPSRDVIQRLRSDGLIHTIPYKASYVSLLDMKSIRQYIYMRIAIETKVIKDAIIMKDDELIKALEEGLRKQEELLETDFTPEEFYKMDGEFHRNWFMHTEKLIVWEEIQKLLVHYTRFRMLDIVMVKNFRAIFEEHKELVRIIKEANFDEVEPMLTKHLYGGIERLGDKISGEYAEFFV